MLRITTAILLPVTLSVVPSAHAAPAEAGSGAPAADRAERLPAFPGAQGFGAHTPGGRGGRVLVVTSLGNEGPGTLRWALEESEGPRFVVFAVGGIIDLTHEINVGGRVTVAGQTAPGEGVVIRGARLHVVGDDVVIRGLKLRPGDGPGQELRVRDGISVGREDGIVRRVVIHGNSTAWAPDENLATWYDVSDVSFTNNIIAEGIDLPGPDGPSMGLLVGDGARRITVANNLFARNAHRNPQIKASREVEVLNNVVYGYGPNGTEVPKDDTGPTSLHVIGNVYLPDASTVDRAPVRLATADARHLYYLHDNIGPGRPDGEGPQAAIAAGPGAGTLRPGPVFASSGAALMPAHRAARLVPALAGAQGRPLDAVDARIVDAVLRREMENAAIAPVFDVPVVRAAWSDTDGDGIPDEIETMLGTDPDRADASEDLNGDGYTNIEDYVNGLASGRLARPEGCVAPGTTVAAAAGDDAADTVIQAEAMELVEGFAADTNPHAQDNGLIRARGEEMARARIVLDVPAGIYDLAVHYFDEDDGVSVLGLRLDDRLVALWPWDEERGSSLVDKTSRTERRIPCLELAPGTTLELFGLAGEDEPLRVDAVVLRPVTP